MARRPMDCQIYLMYIYEGNRNEVPVGEQIGRKTIRRDIEAGSTMGKALCGKG